MRSITLTADDGLLRAAEERARAENTTLDEAFREWLEAYSQRAERADAARAAIHEIRRYARSGGRKFTRDEMNER